MYVIVLVSFYSIKGIPRDIIGRIVLTTRTENSTGFLVEAGLFMTCTFVFEH